MEDDIRMRDQLSYQEKNRQLYIRQKEMLALFLQKRAISQEQYEKSLHDLTEKMGYRDRVGDRLRFSGICYHVI